MTLINIQGTISSPTGVTKHWTLYELYKKTTLVKTIRRAIDQHLSMNPGKPINAGRFGSQLLKEIDLKSFQDSTNLAPQSLGSLFGMVLYNHLSTKDDVWYFRRVKRNPQARASMTYFQAVGSSDQ